MQLTTLSAIDDIGVYRSMLAPNCEMREICKFQLCRGAIVILIWNGFSALATVYDSDGSSINVQPSEGKFGLPHAFWEGLLAKLRQDAPGARAAFTAARDQVEKIVRAQSWDVASPNPLAFFDAELGDKEKAIREGRTACDMLPPAKDAIDGVILLSYLGQTYALIGEKDLALEQLDIVSKLPSGPSYGQLRLDPEWDSLRSDPRFEKIVVSLAPKAPNR
jgi:hypothetical protein